MFELNSYMLQKMGWIEYSHTRQIYYGHLHNNKYFRSIEDDEYVRYFIELGNRNVFFVIKELTEEEKQNSKNRYKFITHNHKEDDLSSILKDDEIIGEFNSNGELFKLIIENEACNSNYERHFRLNKILK
jgi:hypothetical protein